MYYNLVQRKLAASIAIVSIFNIYNSESAQQNELIDFFKQSNKLKCNADIAVYIANHFTHSLGSCDAGNWAVITPANEDL